MAVSGAKERIDAALQSWSGITSQPHRFGGTEYRLGRREIGHVHGDALVDIPFPKKVREGREVPGRPEPNTILQEIGRASGRERGEISVVGALLKKKEEVDRTVTTIVVIA